MTVARAVKRHRRRMVAAPVPELEQSWVIHTLIPSIALGLLLWAFILGAR